MTQTFRLVLRALCVLIPLVLTAAPVDTSFTYQGRLNNSAPANGSVSLEFGLWDAATGGNNVGSPARLSRTAPVANWVFTVDLDFGQAAFNGESRWLEIRIDGVLQPKRTRVAPTPTAIYASKAGAVQNGVLQAGQLATPSAPAAGQVLGFNGSSLVWQTAGAGGGPWQLKGANTYFAGGNVGIGTSTPGVPLHLSSSGSGSSVLAALLQPGLDNGGFNQIYLGRTGAGNACSTFTYVYNEATPSQSYLSLGLYNSSFTFNVRGDGNVGIGTTTPAAKLDLAGDGLVRGRLEVGGPLVMNGELRGNLVMSGATSEDALGVFTVSGWAPAGIFANNTRFTVRRNGQVGIGTSTPQAALDVASGNWDAGRPALRLAGEKPSIVIDGDGASGNRSWLIQLGGPGPGNLQFYTKHGAANWTPALTLAQDASLLMVQGGGGEQAYIGGDGIGNEVQIGSLSDSVTQVAFYNATTGEYMHAQVKTLTIRGGSDLAEPFPIKEEAIEKGSVVVIDEEHPGRLKRSTRAYDQRVAGIVTGANGVNPGISLKQDGLLAQGENVALSGRVYVRADATYGSIAPGDLLTTSDTPGHAMKVTEHSRAHGAILGKAMGALTQGTGMVLVLVTLQ
jgi:hypothetical protein